MCFNATALPSLLLGEGGPEAHGEADEFVGAVELEFGFDARTVGFDGFLADLEFLGDFLIVLRLANVLDDQELSIGETVDMRSFVKFGGIPANAIEDSGANTVAYVKMPLGHFVECLYESFFGGGFH